VVVTPVTSAGEMKAVLQVRPEHTPNPTPSTIVYGALHAACRSRASLPLCLSVSAALVGCPTSATSTICVRLF
jgi:hypothetical protein